MRIFGSIILFIVFVVAYIIIIEVFTVLFRLTGLTQEKAKTQVISMLTNSGFTTNESEVVMVSSKRRRLAQVTMLFGYSFTVIIVSMIVNLFLALSQAELTHMAGAMGAVVVLIILLLLVTRLDIVRSRFDQMIEKWGNRLMFGKDSNPVLLIDIYDNKAMAEIFLEHLPDFLQNVRLADSRLKEDYDIQLLFFKRAGQTIEQIDGNTILHERDILVVFGNYKKIRNVFERPESTGPGNE